MKEAGREENRTENKVVGDGLRCVDTKIRSFRGQWFLLGSNNISNLPLPKLVF
uniref:Uncharacterized protein n=1 Tax=Manihot esculenta TaxID=3983 RepID=A0A2C9UYQ7_MANES